MSGRSRKNPPPPTTPRERREAVDQRRNRAVEEPLDVRLRSSDAYPILEVRNPLHGTAYRVLLPEFPRVASAMCTCADFARRGLGTCKHIEAGFRWLSEHPDATPLLPRGRSSSRLGGVWKEIDRRLLGLPREPGPESLRWRRPGAVLFERTDRAE